MSIAHVMVAAIQKKKLLGTFGNQVLIGQKRINPL